MLNKLFGSEQKIKILNFFFSVSNSGFLSKEIAKNLEVKGPSIKRDLSLLSETGILKIEELDIELKNSKSKKKEEDQGKKNIKREEKYFLNTDHFIYPELKALFEKFKFLANQEVFNEIIEQCKPKVFIVAGKFVNDYKAPIDLLIVGSVNKKNLLKLIVKLENILNQEINYTIFSEDEYFYRQTISDIFLHHVMERKIITLCA